MYQNEIPIPTTGLAQVRSQTIKEQLQLRLAKAEEEVNNLTKALKILSEHPEIGEFIDCAGSLYR